MFAGLRKWRADRKRRKQERYAEEYGFMDPKQLDRLRQQQSPLRRGGRRV